MPISKSSVWAGRAASGVAALVLLADSIAKLLRLPAVLAGTKELGYPESVVFPLGVVLLCCVLLYIYPRTAQLGAVLLTGYLGGAVATHVRLEQALFSQVLFPVYFGVLIWGGLYLRDPRACGMI